MFPTGVFLMPLARGEDIDRVTGTFGAGIMDRQERHQRAFFLSFRREKSVYLSDSSAIARPFAAE
ncbi:MAG: hypothetical protein SAMD01599839_09450 [Rectinema sp.]|jgi:hypothetical protein